MNIHLNFTNKHGREETRVANLPAIPEVGAVISEYASRPGRGNPVSPALQLRVTSGPDFNVIGGWFRNTVDVHVRCELA